jgi:hypothetical protein
MNGVRNMKWLPIENAPNETGVEILGSCWAEGVMIKEPFITFWSPTLNRFYCRPTHYIPMPEPPGR